MTACRTRPSMLFHPGLAARGQWVALRFVFDRLSFIARIILPVKVEPLIPTLDHLSATRFELAFVAIFAIKHRWALNWPQTMQIPILDVFRRFAKFGMDL